ncbi:ATP-binding protein [Streptomyces acidicola]|uniref:ATP-binding protein n=1 Tax=Streptomyces acidicola TaxID=2596892 RepID=UPI002AD233E9|nr:ATP-binding protein [Streptomyces acidicola]
MNSSRPNARHDTVCPWHSWCRSPDSRSAGGVVRTPRGDHGSRRVSLTGPRRGRWRLVLWGEPGIGKSALLRYVHDRAEDFVRLSYSATRPESDLAFAGLHGLLRPVTDRVESLSTAQAAALRAALGLGGEPTNRLLVGAAVLSLLCGLAERQPVLVVVDDGQWLDEATALCLGIVARRVRAHPVVVVLADHSDPGRPTVGRSGRRAGRRPHRRECAAAPGRRGPARRRGGGADHDRGGGGQPLGAARAGHARG